MRTDYINLGKHGGFYYPPAISTELRRIAENVGVADAGALRHAAALIEDAFINAPSCEATVYMGDASNLPTLRFAVETADVGSVKIGGRVIVIFPE